MLNLKNELGLSLCNIALFGRTDQIKGNGLYNKENLDKQQPVECYSQYRYAYSSDSNIFRTFAYCHFCAIQWVIFLFPFSKWGNRHSLEFCLKSYQVTSRMSLIPKSIVLKH